jgi:hypothetical protein
MIMEGIKKKTRDNSSLKLNEYSLLTTARATTSMTSEPVHAPAMISPSDSWDDCHVDDLNTGTLQELVAQYELELNTSLDDFRTQAVTTTQRAYSDSEEHLDQNADADASISSDTNTVDHSLEILSTDWYWHAALIIQAIVRGWIVRQQRAQRAEHEKVQFTRKKTSAYLIQSIWRRSMARTLDQELLLATRPSNQEVYCRHNVSTQEPVDCEDDSQWVPIQNAQSRWQVLNHRNVSSCAAQIQSAARAFMCRKNYARSRKDVLKIQRFARRNHDRHRRLPLRADHRSFPINATVERTVDAAKPAEGTFDSTAMRSLKMRATVRTLLLFVLILFMAVTLHCMYKKLLYDADKLQLDLLGQDDVSDVKEQEEMFRQASLFLDDREEAEDSWKVSDETSDSSPDQRSASILGGATSLSCVNCLNTEIDESTFAGEGVCLTIVQEAVQTTQPGFDYKESASVEISEICNVEGESCQADLDISFVFTSLAFDQSQCEESIASEPVLAEVVDDRSLDFQWLDSTQSESKVDEHSDEYAFDEKNTADEMMQAGFTIVDGALEHKKVDQEPVQLLLDGDDWSKYITAYNEVIDEAEVDGYAFVPSQRDVNDVDGCTISDDPNSMMNYHVKKADTSTVEEMQTYAEIDEGALASDGKIGEVRDRENVDTFPAFQSSKDHTKPDVLGKSSSSSTPTAEYSHQPASDTLLLEETRSVVSEDASAFGFVSSKASVDRQPNNVQRSNVPKAAFLPAYRLYPILSLNLDFDRVFQDTSNEVVSSEKLKQACRSCKRSLDEWLANMRAPIRLAANRLQDLRHLDFHSHLFKPIRDAIIHLRAQQVKWRRTVKVSEFIEGLRVFKQFDLDKLFFGVESRRFFDNNTKRLQKILSRTKQQTSSLTRQVISALKDVRMHVHSIAKIVGLKLTRLKPHYKAIRQKFFNAAMRRPKANHHLYSSFIDLKATQFVIGSTKRLQSYYTRLHFERLYEFWQMNLDVLYGAKLFEDDAQWLNHFFRSQLDRPRFERLNELWMIHDDQLL